MGFWIDNNGRTVEVTRGEAPHGWLVDADTGVDIRPATVAERATSRLARAADGVGVFMSDGRRVYVRG